MDGIMKQPGPVCEYSNSFRIVIVSFGGHSASGGKAQHRDRAIQEADFKIPRPLCQRGRPKEVSLSISLPGRIALRAIIHLFYEAIKL
jgi:hypothetical protein